MNHSVCYYCESNIAITMKFHEPICDECNKKRFSSVQRPNPNESEAQKAFRLKLIISAFKLAFREDDEDDRDI